MTTAISAAIVTVIGLLVRGEYGALAAMTDSRRLTADMIQHAIQGYGRTLRLPPDELPPDLELVQDQNDSRKWHAVMSLWTNEEGQSDLGLELTLTEVADGVFEVEIDDLHVL